MIQSLPVRGGTQRGAEAARRTLMLTVTVVLGVVLIATVNAVTVEWGFFNVSTDFNLAGIVSGCLFGIAAYVCLQVFGRLGARIWLALGLLAALLALETFVGVHDRLEEIEALEKPLFVAYPLVGLIVLALVARPVLRLEPPCAALVIAAGGLLILSAIAEAAAQARSGIRQRSQISTPSPANPYGLSNCSERPFARDCDRRGTW